MENNFSNSVPWKFTCHSLISGLLPASPQSLPRQGLSFGGPGYFGNVQTSAWDSNAILDGVERYCLLPPKSASQMTERHLPKRARPIRSDSPSLYDCGKFFNVSENLQDPIQYRISCICWEGFNRKGHQVQ